MKSIIIPFLIGLTITANAQYSQSIDSLSNKEIRYLILNQKGTEANKTMRAHQETKVIGTIGLLGAAFMFGAAANEDDPMGKSIGVTYGLGFLAFSTLFYAVSNTYFLKAKKQYKKSTDINQSSAHIRDEQMLFKE